MALTVKHLNSDASFLLSFEPLLPEAAQGTVTPRPFTILLDPWLTGPSHIFHKAISATTHKQAPCITSLLDLPEPDLVIISQHKSDHCHEETLRQLPARNTRTIILAEPAAARLIRSWKHFENSKVRTIPRWEDPRVTGRQAVLRIPVPAVGPGGLRGEVTIAFIPQKRDIAGLHGAIGITYRPPSTHNLAIHGRPIPSRVTPPTTPGALKTTFSDFRESLMGPHQLLLPPSPPTSAHSLRSCRSASSLAASPTSPHASREDLGPRSRPISSIYSSHVLTQSALPKAQKTIRRIPSTTSHCHPVSVIFSPHGISWSALEPYATSHLVAEAALPLTALLHCIDSVDNPWWMGGNINTGTPGGAVIAAKLSARIWVGAHDGDKNVSGLATGLLKIRRFRRSETREVVAQAHNANIASTAKDLVSTSSTSKDTSIVQISGESTPLTGASTEIMQLGSGEEFLVSGDGAMLWHPNAPTEDDDEGSDNNEEQIVPHDGQDFIIDNEQVSKNSNRHSNNYAAKSSTWLGKDSRLRARASMSFITHRLKM